MLVFCHFCLATDRAYLLDVVLSSQVTACRYWIVVNRYHNNWVMVSPDLATITWFVPLHGHIGCWIRMGLSELPSSIIGQKKEIKTHNNLLVLQSDFWWWMEHPL